MDKSTLSMVIVQFAMLVITRNDHGLHLQFLVTSPTLGMVFRKKTNKHGRGVNSWKANSIRAFFVHPTSTKMSEWSEFEISSALLHSMGWQKKGKSKPKTIDCPTKILGFSCHFSLKHLKPINCFIFWWFSYRDSPNPIRSHWSLVGALLLHRCRTYPEKGGPMDFFNTLLAALNFRASDVAREPVLRN